MPSGAIFLERHSLKSHRNTPVPRKRPQTGKVRATTHMDVFRVKQLPDSFKKLFGKTAEVLCNFWRLNCIVQSFAHHRQNVVKAVWQIPLGPI